MKIPEFTILNELSATHDVNLFLEDIRLMSEKEDTLEMVLLYGGLRLAKYFYSADVEARDFASEIVTICAQECVDRGLEKGQFKLCYGNRQVGFQVEVSVAPDAIVEEDTVATTGMDKLLDLLILEEKGCQVAEESNRIRGESNRVWREQLIGQLKSLLPLVISRLSPTSSIESQVVGDYSAIDPLSGVALDNLCADLTPKQIRDAEAILTPKQIDALDFLYRRGELNKQIHKKIQERMIASTFVPPGSEANGAPAPKASEPVVTPPPS